MYLSWSACLLQQNVLFPLKDLIWSSSAFARYSAVTPKRPDATCRIGFKHGSHPNCRLSVCQTPVVNLQLRMQSLAFWESYNIPITFLYFKLKSNPPPWELENSAPAWSWSGRYPLRQCPISRHRLQTLQAPVEWNASGPGCSNCKLSQNSCASCSKIYMKPKFD